jgi:hypothetical protein
MASTLVLVIGTVVGLVRVFTLGASPLWASAALYGATVGYGLAEMAKLRERHLFRPGQPPTPDSAFVWWTLRVLLVTGVATLPAVMMLGGLTAR